MIPELFSLAGIGLLSSLGLGIASKRLAIEVDPRLEKILEALPGANCGACGYAGCNAFAKAVLEETAPLNGCVAGGEETMNKVAAVLGKSVEKGERAIAVVACSGTRTQARLRFIYQGIDDCRAAVNVGGGDKACPYGCLGLGSCQKVCPFGAITIEDNLASIDPEKCVGCGLCVDECPRDVIHLVPADAAVQVLCSSHESGRDVKSFCHIGCIGCGACERVCPFNAITVSDNLAEIDLEKCVACGLCIEICPQNTIQDFIGVSQKAFIDSAACVSCGKCKTVCPFNAITGDKQSPYTVLTDKCRNCGLCVRQCKVDAITLREVF